MASSGVVTVSIAEVNLTGGSESIVVWAARVRSTKVGVLGFMLGFVLGFGSTLASIVASIASRSSLRFCTSQRRFNLRPPTTANTQTIVIPSHIIAFLSPNPTYQAVRVNSTTLLVNTQRLIKIQKEAEKNSLPLFPLFRLVELTTSDEFDLSMFVVRQIPSNSRGHYAATAVFAASSPLAYFFAKSSRPICLIFVALPAVPNES